MEIKMKRTIGLLAYLLALPVFASWQLDNNSSHLSFVSVKKAQIAETHSFKSLAGKVDGKNVQFSVDLASVSTGIPIRDERMTKFLFITKMFPSATFNATIPANLISSMKVGEIKHFDLSGTLTVKDKSQNAYVKTMLVKAADNKLVVSSVKPLIVKASDYGLASGIAKLAELAKLSSITESVPVSFTLTFNK